MTDSVSKAVQRERIILWHLDGFTARGFTTNPHSRPDLFSPVEERVQRCMEEIAKTEGKNSLNTDFALKESITERFRRQESRDLADRLAAIKEKYAALIDQFCVVAERKVSLRDEYGDENWDALDKEVSVVIVKIMKREGSLGQLLHRQLSEYLRQSLREHYQKKRTQPIARVDFATMGGEDFEAYLMDLLSRLGYTVSGTKASGDQGADILARKDGRGIAIQAKCYSGPVGNSAVQEVAAAVHFYSADEGWVITNSTFTPAARELAQRTRVRLIDGHELQRLCLGR